MTMTAALRSGPAAIATKQACGKLHPHQLFWSCPGPLGLISACSSVLKAVDIEQAYNELDPDQLRPDRPSVAGSTIMLRST